MRAVLFILSLFVAWSAQAANIHFIEVNGTINPGSADYILESIHEAESDKADLLVLRLNTPGGLLVSTRNIIQGISESTVPVAVWVAPGGASATSAGALIALSAHVLAMADGTNIGAAHPVGNGGEEVKGVMGEKVTNDTAALARSQAALRGRNIEAAEMIVTKSRSFSSREALELKIADFEAADLNALLKRISGRRLKVGSRNQELTLTFAENTPEKEIKVRSMSTKQRFLHFISDPNISAMLLSLAGLALWAEISSGFHSIAAGVIGAFCFLLAMISLQTLPINLGGALLMVLGFALLLAEAFVTSFGLLAVSALICLFLGGLFLIDPSSGSMHVSLFLLISMVTGLGSVVLLVGFILWKDRHRIGMNSNPLLGQEARISTVEVEGKSGTAYVNGELWNFESDFPVTTNELHRIRSMKDMTLHLERGKNHGTN